MWGLLPLGGVRKGKDAKKDEGKWFQTKRG